MDNNSSPLRHLSSGALKAIYHHPINFLNIHYAISPTLVKWFGKTQWFQKLWRGVLDRMVAKLQDKGFENTPYEDKNW